MLRRCLYLAFQEAVLGVQLPLQLQKLVLVLRGRMSQVRFHLLGLEAAAVVVEEGLVGA